jgi:prophage tail gpP-like protein
MSARIWHAEHDVLDPVIDPSTGRKGGRLRVAGEIMKIGLEEPECLGRLAEYYTQETYQKGAVHGLFAEIQDELFQRHRNIVDADDEMTQLRQEEFNLLVRKLPQFRAKHIVNANMVGVSSASDQQQQAHVKILTSDMPQTRTDSG